MVGYYDRGVIKLVIVRVAFDNDDLITVIVLLFMFQGYKISAPTTLVLSPVI